MKRILLQVFVIFFIILVAPQTYAQTSIPVPSLPIPEISGVPLPGVNCGYENMRCCYFKPIEVGIPSPNIPGIDLLVGAINGLIDTYFTGPVFKPMNQFALESSKPCMEGLEPTTPGEPTRSDCTCRKITQGSLTTLLNLCKGITSSAEKKDCEACLTGSNPEKVVGVWTGAGCIYTNTSKFVTNILLGWGIGLAGTASLICIIFAAIQMQMSSGNPEKVKKTQEMLTSCIMGLILIIFSVFILRLIGITILRIPGFS
jgi:hypothetical protein